MYMLRVNSTTQAQVSDSGCHWSSREQTRKLRIGQGKRFAAFVENMKSTKLGGPMKAHWLVVQSFQQSQDLLDAINTLSIHTKLELAGVRDEQRADPAEDARRKIDNFLKELKRHVEAELNEGRPVV